MGNNMQQCDETLYGTAVLHGRDPRQGHSQKWPKEGVLRPEIGKGGGFEGVEALPIGAGMLFC